MGLASLKSANSASALIRLFGPVAGKPDPLRAILEPEKARHDERCLHWAPVHGAGLNQETDRPFMASRSEFMLHTHTNGARLRVGHVGLSLGQISIGLRGLGQLVVRPQAVLA